MNNLFVLSVNPDTWRGLGWRLVGVFRSEVDANHQGNRFKQDSGPYSGYRVEEISFEPTYEQWSRKEEEDD